MNQEHRALSGFRFNRKQSAQAPNSLFYTQYSHALLPAWLESNSVVLHRHGEPRLIPVNVYTNMSCLRVRGAVVERLLDNAVYAGPMRVGQILSDLIGGHLYFETRAARHFASLPFEGGNQSKIIQHGGAQQQSQIAYLSDAGFCHAANASQPLTAGFVVGRCLEPPQLNQHG